MKWLALAVFIPSIAAADPMVLHVTEIAGDLAFVDAGADAGLAANQDVQIGQARYTVVEVNAKTAAVRVSSAVAIGATGSAAPATPPKPLALADNTGQWPRLVPPAEGQQPNVVPSDPAAVATERVRLAVIAHGYGTLGQGHKRGYAELRVIGEFALMQDHPLGLDVDVAARAYAQGYTADARVPLFVNTATLRYGDPISPALAIGRLHFAATTLGILDGGRAALHAGHVEIAAFGGVVPDPITGKPDTTATRFGGEMIYDDTQSELRPRIAIVAHGSTWDGKLDERRLDVTASAVVGGTWLDGWVETQQFPSGNPFGAKAFEVTGAGASIEWRRRDAHAGIDATYLTPERSLRIAALIPEWLCTRVPQAPGTPEPCTGDDRFVSSTLSGGVRGAHWALDAAASIAATRALESSLGGSGYLRGEYRSGIVALHATGAGGKAEFANWESVEAGIGIAPSRRFDAEVSYRPEWLHEEAGSAVMMHAVVADGRVAIAPSLDLGMFLLASVGGSQDVFAALTTLAWRPRF